MPVYFAPPQQRLGKARVVYRVRRELRFKTHGAAGLIYRPILSAAPGQPVGRIQLHTGRGGVHRHGDAAAVAPQHRRTAQIRARFFVRLHKRWFTLMGYNGTIKIGGVLVFCRREAYL